MQGNDNFERIRKTRDYEPREDKKRNKTRVKDQRRVIRKTKEKDWEE